MATLYLVRHARTIVDPGVPASAWGLDPAGADALAALAARPCFAGVHRIVSSSEPKALLTAEAIRSRHGLPAVEPRDALRELHKGSFVGDRHDEVMAAVFRHPDQPVLPGWERACDAQARVADEIGRLVTETAGRDLIVVSHGVVLALYLARLNGQAHVDFNQWQAMRMPDCVTVDTEAAAATVPAAGPGATAAAASWR